MMNQQKSAKAGILKYSLIVPLALALVLSSNAQTVVTQTKKVLASATQTVIPASKEEVKAPEQSSFSDLKNATDPVDKDKVYQNVDKMPQYGSGDKSVMEYLAMNIKYPVEAQKNNERGKVFVRFIVNEAGKVVKPEIMKSVSKSLDQEALRVVKAMPDWTPGESKGKKVSVYYTVPIDFKIDDGTQTNSTPTPNAVTVTTYKDVPSTTVKPIDSKNLPLIVLDGAKMASDFDVNSIKPETIESVDVLKAVSEKRRAELVEQYGKEAENGVVLIKTKK